MAQLLHKTFRSPCVIKTELCSFASTALFFCCASLLVIGLLLSQTARAEFTLNFRPAPEEYIVSNLPGSFSTTHINSDNGSNRDPSLNTGMTRYLMSSNFERPEIVRDPISGKHYYHMILGSMGDGFIQEVYIEMGLGFYGSDAESTTGGPAASASGGTGQYSWADGDKNNPDSLFGNGYDPLDMDVDDFAKKEVSGNGTANPRRVLMRQVMSDGEVMTEFLKDRYEYKPRISQMISARDIQANFVIDMRNSTYDSATDNAFIANTMFLAGAGVPASLATYDMSTHSQHSNVSGGRYRYVEGGGFGGAEGAYEYAGGSFDHEAQDWKEFVDPFVSNPWSFADSKLP